MKIGTIENPYVHAPDDWFENGVPYGAFCKCSKCGYVGTSTVLFDYYANNPGELLICEYCQFSTSYEVEKQIRKYVLPKGKQEEKLRLILARFEDKHLQYLTYFKSGRITSGLYAELLQQFFEITIEDILEIFNDS